LLRLPPGGRLILNFWTPICSSCKPVLSELAALADMKPRKLAFLGVVQSADPELVSAEKGVERAALGAKDAQQLLDDATGRVRDSR